MISSAIEFKKLRESELKEEYSKASLEEATIETWMDILKKFPELSFWVAQNKTIQIEILEILADSKEVEVRCMVARKRKINILIFDKLKNDIDETVRHALIFNQKISIELKHTIKVEDSEWLKNKLNEYINN